MNVAKLRIVRVNPRGQLDKQLVQLLPLPTAYCATSKRKKLFKNVSDKLKHIFHYTEDNNLKHRLAFFAGSDDSLITIALEIKYHSSCLRQCERIADRLSNSDNSNEYKLKLQMAYSEITNIVKNTLYMTDIAFVDMNDVHTTFLNILSESNIEITNENYKPILKRIFIENIPNISFKKPKNPTIPE